MIAEYESHGFILGGHGPENGRFTGARRSPPHAICAAFPFAPRRATPSQWAWLPKTLNAWGNSSYGDCVSAEEAFAKACYGQDGNGGGQENEIFISEQTVIDWARRGGYLNGADLVSVMKSMAQSGFQVGSQLYNDGGYSSVDYSNEAILQAAIVEGPVKIAIAASVLPRGAGSQMGWWVAGNHGGRNTDHCVALAGFGTAQWLFDRLNAVYGNVSLPSGLSPTAPGYLIYTWKTIGFVDHPWIMGTVPEAWVRHPTTLGVPPLPPLVPPGPPVASLTLPPGLIVPYGEYTVGDPANPAAMLWTRGINEGTYKVNVPTPPNPS